MFEELYKFISRLHYGIKFMPEKDFDELLSLCDWQEKIYALCFRYFRCRERASSLHGTNKQYLDN